ncbi:MAG: ABC transporter permease [Bacteroidetes bacterium]|nr:ABC transporter permease [Bacteroidota bacterium]
MVLNYLKIAFRNFSRHLGYSSITIFGLSIGLATSLMIFVWVLDELRFDTGYDDHERIYQVLTNAVYTNGDIKTSESTTGALAEAIANEIPEVEEAGRAGDEPNMLLRHENNSVLQDAMWADPSMLKIFSVHVLQGNPANLLVDPNSFILTKKTADKFFPGQDAIGKSFTINEKYKMTVSAVVEDPLPNSSFRFAFLLPYDVHYKENPWMAQWGNYNDMTFIKVKPGVNVSDVNVKLKKLMKSKCPDCHHQPFAQQFAERHLYNHYENGKADGGRIEYIRIFTLAAIFILVIACINYMNLATARSAGRSREVGVRKAIGSHRSQLIGQFIGESLLITTLSTLLAVVMVQLMTPLFNTVMNKQMTVDFTDPKLLIALVSLTVVTSLIAGSYPAFFLSSFRPASVLKGQLQSTLAGATLRKGLVVFQFALSAMLIIASLATYKQTQFILSKNLGFNRENVLVFDMHAGVSSNQATFKNEALKFPGIHAISFAGQNPFSIGMMTTGVKWPGKDEKDIVPFKLVFTDKDFLPTLKMELIEGSNFTDEKADSTHYIINEAAVKRIGLKNAIGASLNVWNSPSGKVIGVVKDFHNVNLHNAIEPLIIMCRTDNTWRGFVKVEANATQQAIKHLESVQKKFDPNYPFQYEFLDKSFEKEYTSETTIEKLSIVFTAIAIFISSLGLFGLASFMTERRTKEIGIRKVMGASARQITVLLSSDFLKLLLISFVVAVPIAWYGVSQWLITFAYHADLNFSLPLIAAGVLFMTAVLSVGYQSVKAALGNPVNSLKNE